MRFLSKKLGKKYLRGKNNFFQNIFHFIKVRKVFKWKILININQKEVKMPKTAKQIAVKIRSLKKQVTRLERQKKRAAKRKKKR